MKKITLSLAFAIAGSFAMAQNTAKDIFNKDNIVWCGLDFSKAKMIGQFDQGYGISPASGSDIKSKYAPGWNGLIINEQKKYDLGRTFRKTNVNFDINVT